jgi:hypothetical protein
MSAIDLTASDRNRKVAAAVAHEQVVLEWRAEETRHGGMLWVAGSPLSVGIVVAS